MYIYVYKIKRKKLRNMSTNSIRKCFLRDLMNTFHFSNSNVILMHFVILRL